MGEITKNNNQKQEKKATYKTAAELAVKKIPLIKAKIIFIGKKQKHYFFERKYKIAD